MIVLQASRQPSKRNLQTYLVPNHYGLHRTSTAWINIDLGTNKCKINFSEWYTDEDEEQTMYTAKQFTFCTGNTLPGLLEDDA